MEKLRKILMMSDMQLMLYLVNLYKDTVTDYDNFIYVNGSNKDICVVAHIDTVRLHDNVILIEQDGIIRNKNGILGADDRAGVWACLQLHKKYDVPILFTNYEESGCLGSYALTEQSCYDSLFEKTKMFIEIDRKGSNHFVTYQTMPDEIINYVKSFGYEEKWGSYSDIAILTKAYRIPSVNMATGYYNEHTANEYLVVSELKDVVTGVGFLIECSDAIEHMEVEETTTKMRSYGYTSYTGKDYSTMDMYDYYDGYNDGLKKYNSSKKTYTGKKFKNSTYNVTPKRKRTSLTSEEKEFVRKTHARYSQEVSKRKSLLNKQDEFDTTIVIDPNDSHLIHVTGKEKSTENKNDKGLFEEKNSICYYDAERNIKRFTTHTTDGSFILYFLRGDIHIVTEYLNKDKYYGISNFTDNCDIFLYKTTISHPNYDSGAWVTVADFLTGREAVLEHERWVELLGNTNHDLPTTITNVKTATLVRKDTLLREHYYLNSGKENAGIIIDDDMEIEIEFEEEEEKEKQDIFGRTFKDWEKTAKVIETIQVNKTTDRTVYKIDGVTVYHHVCFPNNPIRKHYTWVVLDLQLPVTVENLAIVRDFNGKLDGNWYCSKGIRMPVFRHNKKCLEHAWNFIKNEKVKKLFLSTLYKTKKEPTIEIITSNGNLYV